MARPAMVMAFAVMVVGVGSACSGSPTTGADHCGRVAAAVDAGALDDDLVTPSLGPRSLQDRLGAAITTTEAAAESASGEAEAAWSHLATSLHGVRDELAAVGFDLLGVLAGSRSTGDPAVPASAQTPSGDDTAADAIEIYASAATTRARQEAAADAEQCGVDVSEPGSVLLAAVTGAIEPAGDPRTGDLRSLPTEQLAAVLARSFGQDELAELLRSFSAVSVSELAQLLAEAPVEDELASDTLAEVARRVTVDGPGDDETLDALFDACVADGAVACDLLASLAPIGSEYGRFGATCGDRRAASQEPCGDAELR